MKGKIFGGIVIIQIFIIGYFIVRITSQRAQSQASKIYPINKNSIQYSSSSSYKYFYEPKPNSLDTANPWGPTQPRYTINSDSLNERFDYSPEKENGVFRIITLGDSFTYGLYVSTQYNWTEVLEDMLNNNNPCPSIQKYEVINLAMQGYDAAYNVERYRKRGVKYNPDLILWLLYDPTRNTEKINEKIEKNKAAWIRVGANPDSYEIWNRAYTEVMGEYTPEQIKQYQQETLSEINNYYSGKLLFFYQKYIGVNWAEKPFSYIDDFVRSRKNSSAYQITNIQSNDLYHFATDNHPNEVGHKVIANEIAEYIKKANAISCPRETDQ